MSDNNNKDYSWLTEYFLKKSKEKITLITTKRIQQEIEKYPQFDPSVDLKRILVFSGALKFKRRSDSAEMWGLASENYSELGFKNKQAISMVLKKMEKDRDNVPKYLAQVILLHPRYNQRKFSTICEKMDGFTKNEIRRILVFSGALKFRVGEKEYWGLATKSLDLLGFSSENTPKKIIGMIRTNPERMPFHLISLILEHPLYYRRSIDAIKQKIGGFSTKEIRLILYEVGAMPFRDDKKREYWGLEARNKKLLKKLGWTK